MADTKISALTAATTPLAGTEVLPIVQSGVTKKVSIADLTAGRDVAGLSLSLNSAPVRDTLNLSFKQLFYNTAGDGVANTVIGQIRSQVRNYGTNIATASFASIQFATDPTTWYKGEIRFLTNGNDGTNDAGTVNLTIKSSGTVQVNTGALGIASGLTIGNATSTGSFVAITSSVLSSGAGTHFLKWSNVSGNVTYDTSSRLVKTDIEDSKYGLAEILKLRPRKYYRTDDQCVEHGLIADEVVDNMPEFVPMVPKHLLTKNMKDVELVPGTVKYDRLITPLINAVHELSAQIDALKIQIGK